MVCDSRETFALGSTIQFSWRNLDTTALRGGAIDRSPTLQECARVILTFSLRGRESALVLWMRSRALAKRDENPPWPLPVFHFLKIETSLGQALQRIHGILYGFLTMFCCLPKRPTVFRPIPCSYASCPSHALLGPVLRLSVVVPPDWRHCLNLPIKFTVRLDASLGSGARRWLRSRSGFLQATTSTRVMFANPEPFKVVSELVRFQRLGDFLLGMRQENSVCLNRVVQI